MSTQAGLLHLWAIGDWVSRSVFLVLFAMSLASWSVMLIKALDSLRIRREAARVESFWHSNDVAEGLARLGRRGDNPFRDLAVEGRDAAAHHRAMQGQLHDSLDISDWILRALQGSIDSTAARLQAGLVVLASVGSTAPFVGLFGTVWGIYNALMRIGVSGQANIEQVAGPIGEALIMTALGLVVAIPAVLAYNALLRGNKNMLVRLRRFAYDLHAYYVTGSRMGARAGGSTVVEMKKA